LTLPQRHKDTKLNILSILCVFVARSANCCAVDCGIVINPDAAANLAEGTIVDGVGNALFGELTIQNGVPEKK